MRADHSLVTRSSRGCPANNCLALTYLWMVTMCPLLPILLTQRKMREEKMAEPIHRALAVIILPLVGRLLSPGFLVSTGKDPSQVLEDIPRQTPWLAAIGWHIHVYGIHIEKKPGYLRLPQICYRGTRRRIKLGSWHARDTDQDRSDHLLCKVGTHLNSFSKLSGMMLFAP